MIPNTTSASTPATTRTIIDDVSGIYPPFRKTSHPRRTAMSRSEHAVSRQNNPAVPRKLYDLPCFQSTTIVFTTLATQESHRFARSQYTFAICGSPGQRLFSIPEIFVPLNSCALRCGNSCRVIDQYQYRLHPPVRPQYSTALEPAAR